MGSLANRCLNRICGGHQEGEVGFAPSTLYSIPLLRGCSMAGECPILTTAARGNLLPRPHWVHTTLLSPLFPLKPGDDNLSWVLHCSMFVRNPTTSVNSPLISTLSFPSLSLQDADIYRHICLLPINLIWNPLNSSSIPVMKTLW